MSDRINRNTRGEEIASFSLTEVQKFGRAVAEQIIADRSRSVTVAFEPGNGFRYVVVLTPVPSGMVGNDWLLSLPEERTCYPIGFLGTTTDDYLIEKGLVQTSTHAMPLSIFLNEIGYRVNLARKHEEQRRALDARHAQEIAQMEFYQEATGATLMQPAVTDAEAAEDWTGVEGA